MPRRRVSCGPAIAHLVPALQGVCDGGAYQPRGGGRRLVRLMPLTRPRLAQRLRPTSAASCACLWCENAARFPRARVDRALTFLKLDQLKLSADSPLAPINQPAPSRLVRAYALPSPSPSRARDGSGAPTASEDADDDDDDDEFGLIVSPHPGRSWRAHARAVLLARCAQAHRPPSRRRKRRSPLRRIASPLRLHRHARSAQRAARGPRARRSTRRGRPHLTEECIT